MCWSPAGRTTSTAPPTLPSTTPLKRELCYLREARNDYVVGDSPSAVIARHVCWRRPRACMARKHNVSLCDGPFGSKKTELARLLYEEHICRIGREKGKLRELT